MLFQNQMLQAMFGGSLVYTARLAMLGIGLSTIVAPACLSLKVGAQVTARHNCNV
jgi:hypothetical protein